MYTTKPISQRTFPILETEIFERGIKKKEIAQKLGIGEKALSNKLKGVSPFTWDEAAKLHSIFFQDVPIKQLLGRKDA